MLADAGLDRIRDPTAVEFGNYWLHLKIGSDISSRLCVRKLIKKYGELAKVGVFVTFPLRNCILPRLR